jgi:hypothetical protein
MFPDISEDMRIQFVNTFQKDESFCLILLEVFAGCGVKEDQEIGRDIKSSARIISICERVARSWKAAVAARA